MELCVEQINKSFGGKQVLKKVSFTVKGGQALGLLGRNGAGKTTTLRILTDIFRADSGRVMLNGAPIDYASVRMGYLPEERGLYPKIGVGEQMLYMGQLKGLTRAEAKKNATALLEELDALPYWDKKLDTLSKGNQQKIQLAMATLHKPDIIILDEPFSGLDPVNAQMLKALIVKQVESGKLVLFSSHQMPYVEEFCQHICILNRGEIALDGRIKDIKRQYLRNRIAITPEGDPKVFLAEASRADGWHQMVMEAVCRGEMLEISLRDAKDKRPLLALLSACGMGIDSFAVIEPTLEEIFVEKAGDNK